MAHLGRRSSCPSQPHPIKELSAPLSITLEACSIAEEVKVLASAEKTPEVAPIITIPEAAAQFMKDVISESIITFNINSALANNDDDAFREEDEDLSFLFK